MTVDLPRSAPSLLADRYEVDELIGRGGMADVHAGTDLRLNRPVAVKLLQAHMAERADVKTRFEAEARSAARLTSPHAVAVYDTGEHDGVPYIVMERLPGETLADRIARGPLEPEELRPLALEVLAALAEAHRVGLVHRDVKPGNILLTADGHAKIADFGIAKSVQESSLSDLTVTGQVLGTPAYLAPEQLDGVAASPRSDVYALGVVLYEALTGFKPFQGTTAMAVARAVAAGDHRPLDEVRPDLDPRLVAIVERALATDPARRFSSAADMATALSALSGGAATVVDQVAGRPDPTMVLDTAALGGGPSGPSSGRHSAAAGPGTLAGRRRPPLGVRLALVAGLAVFALVLLLRACSPDPDPVADPRVETPTTQARTTQATQTTAQSSSPAAVLARAMRAEADRLSPADGARASDLANGLRSVADQVEAGGGGPAATGLLVSVATWNRDDQLTDGATVTAVQLLQQVPGVSVAPTAVVTTAPARPPTTAARPPTTASDRGRGNDKGKDAEKDD